MEYTATCILIMYAIKQLKSMHRPKATATYRDVLSDKGHLIAYTDFISS